MINGLIDIMIDEGLKVPSRYDTYESISDAVYNGTIKSIVRNGQIIGFFTWREIKKNNKLYIYIENLCIKRAFRHPTNLLFLRKFFRIFYGKRFEFAYWHSQKQDIFIYAK